MNSFLIAISAMGLFSGNLMSVPEIPKFDVEETLAFLSYCESSGNSKAYRADDNGSPSIGLFQFKLETWNWAIKRYYRKIFPGNFYFTLDIMNPDHQRMVARVMIEDGRYEQHWKVCFAKSKKYFGF